VRPSHSGIVIADALRETFHDWGILRKVFSITVDNASANGAAIEILRDNFRLKGIILPVRRLFFMLGAVPILKICWCKQGFRKSGT
jgi:hypothetical protein